MLEIKNISKKYITGDLVQTALNDVSLNLRDNEFVAVLGPSGSGKTTLLNIIGGLDRYDSGDLIINNISTKDYRDADWDTYRNHTIGFVFQSYNLIPHQTVLSNVELALTIAGISKQERRQRALQALDEVGLKDQAHKKPNQMSGGQMQRVAIARALVNNPDIVLADEPTGALDSKTSIQVMNLLKEVAKDRLVVMVTHNPELADEYANRIVKLQDGQIVSDSNPYEIDSNVENDKKMEAKRAHMSILTSLSLSFNNLLTKKGRTILTAFAGSIGIIGIALILSLSQGFKNYIDKIQEDTLSSYPLTITSETADTTSAILSMVSDRKENKAEGENIIERQYLTTMFSSIGTNDLRSFKKFLEDNQTEVDKYTKQIRYSYSVSPQIYTIDGGKNLTKIYPSSILSSMYSTSSLTMMSSLSAGGGGIFSEMSDDLESLKNNYDVLKGRWPEKFDEIIIVLPEPNSISDLLVYSLGLRDTNELKSIITSLMTGEEVTVEHDPLKLTYDDLLNLDLRVIKATDTYKYNEKYSIYEDMSSDNEYMNDQYDNAIKLKVVGIISPKKDNESAALSAGVSYTKALTKYIIDSARNTKIVNEQLLNKDVDVFSNKKFDEENVKEEPKLNFEDMISIDENMIKDAFKINVSNNDMFEPEDIAKITTTTAETMLAKIGYDYSQYVSIIKTIVPLVYPNMVTSFSKIQEYKNGIISIYSQENKADFINKYWTSDDYYKLINTISSVATSLLPDLTINADMVSYLCKDTANLMFTNYAPDLITYLVKMNNSEITNQISATAKNIVDMQNYGVIAQGVGEAIGKTLSPMMNMFGEDLFEIDTDKFAKAFKFDMDQDELSRIMQSMMSKTEEKTYRSNLISLGYQDEDEPTNISFYFKDFEAKENFITLIDKDNETLDEDSKLHYTDITGILMSSVKTIVDSVTYVLIAFVSISLVVSSIMIAVITLISVMERTKEIGILRAMGASKHNVSSIFNAETFIIGLLSGLLGVGVTYLSIPPINALIHNVTDNYDINAVLPTNYAIILVFISILLTIIAGIIPSRKAAKQDPVIALRTE